MRYVLRKGRDVGFLELYQRMRSRNACKTCALGMGGQAGGMVNEVGHFPEVCKKSVQAQAADMGRTIEDDYFARTSVDELERLTSAQAEALGRLTFPVILEPGENPSPLKSGDPRRPLSELDVDQMQSSAVRGARRHWNSANGEPQRSGQRPQQRRLTRRRFKKTDARRNTRMTRTYGTGSVYQRSDGRWVAQLMNKLTGKPVQKTANTESGARKKLREMSSRVDAGKPATDKAVSFRTYFETWLVADAERGRSAATANKYEQLIRNHALDRIGGRQIGKLSEVDVENLLYAVWKEKDLSASTLNLLRSAISVVLKHAVRAKAVSTNVAAGVQVPTEARKSEPVMPPSTEHVRALLAATQGTELGRLLVLAGLSGARIGEILGAKWSDVNLSIGEWTISRTITKDRRDRTIIGKTTKGKKIRPLVMPPTALVALREQRSFVIQHRLGAPDWQDNDLIFPTERGTARDSSNLRKQLHKAKNVAYAALCSEAAKYGNSELPEPFPGAFHALRHFFSSVTLTELTAAEVQQLLGHSSVSLTTGIYGHLTVKTATRGPALVERELA
jgi:integrase